MIQSFLDGAIRASVVRAASVIATCSIFLNSSVTYADQAGPVPQQEQAPAAFDQPTNAPTVMPGSFSHRGSDLDPTRKRSAQPVVEALPGMQFGPVYDPKLTQIAAKAPRLRWTNPPASVPTALQDAIAIVSERDPAALASWWRVRAASAGIRSARWQRFPALTVDTNVSANSNWLLPSLTVDLPIWSGGRINAGINRAKSQQASAEAGWDEVILDLSLLVGDTYFDIVLNSRLQIVYEESLAAHRDLVGTMERRVAQQISAQADLELAQSRAAQIEQEMLIVQSQRDTALQTLAELIRDPAYQLGNAPEFEKSYLMQNWADVNAEALAYSPTRRRLTEEANVAEQDVKLARSSLFPQISAQYAYNDVTGGRAGVGVRVQTGNGLSRFADIDGAQARFQTATNQTRLFERQLRQDLAGEVTLNLAALSRSEVSRTASLSAKRVSESYLRQFIAGRRSWLDVMNSLRENLAAQSGLLQAEVTAMATNVRLNLRSGRWRPERVSGE